MAEMALATSKFPRPILHGFDLVNRTDRSRWEKLQFPGGRVSSTS